MRARPAARSADPGSSDHYIVIFLLHSFSSLKTATPFPQRWGLLRKGHAVFRREDRFFEKSIFCWGRSCWRRLRMLHAMMTHSALFYGVVRRHSEK
jgi:hypothetical protein